MKKTLKLFKSMLQNYAVF